MINRLLNYFNYKPTNEKQLLKILAHCTTTKIIDKDAMTMIEGVLNVSKMKVRDTMIPRAQMITVERENNIDDITKIITESRHSRFPVVGENKDDILGILLAKDLLSLTEEDNFDITNILHTTIFVPESKRLDNLLHEFQIKHCHMAIVLDEYGGISGLVTIEDVLEKIVGDIEDEGFTTEDELVVKQAYGVYSIMGRASIDSVNTLLEVNISNEEFDTIGGIIAANFGKIPKVGAKISLHGLHFTIKKVSKKQILLMQVKNQRL